MSAQNPGSQPPSSNEESKYIAYQTNHIPWYVHVMWILFSIAGIAYLLKFALADFIRWW